MRIVDLRVVEGPNVHSRTPVAEMLIDLGAFDGVFTRDIPDFTARILKMVPTLAEHYCSVGHPGGFVERLREGTLLGHVIEHVALELQALAGASVFYGKTRGTPRRGVYRVVYEASERDATIEAGRSAVRLVDAAARGGQCDVARRIEKIRRLMLEGGLGPSTRAIVEAAERFDVPVMRLDDASYVQLGYGELQRRIRATVTCLTPGVAIDVAKDKNLTKTLLGRNGIPVPAGALVTSQKGAVRTASQIGFPVVIKPVDGNQGKGVFLNLGSDEEVATAYKLARAYSRRVIVEKYLSGRHYRVLVVGGTVVAAAERVPAHVIGDGLHTIRELVEISNSDPRRGESHEKPLTRIRIDRIVQMTLARSDLSLQDVPEPGQVVYLRDNSNLSTGGIAIDVTGDIHPDNVRACARAAAIIGLDVAGIDIVTPSIAESLFADGGAIIEVNAGPGIRMHHFPSHGRSRDVGAAIVEHLFPPGSRSRIPIVAVTGTNGKTTVTRMVAHVLAQCGVVTGVATTDGVFVGGSRIVTGDTTGPASARAVLQDPHVQCAALETARGGIIRSGLGFDRCDVGVLTNISDDHLGQDGVESLEELSRVKSVVLDAVMRDGHAVLNADDPASLQMMERCKCRIILFSMAGWENLLVRRHTTAGGTAVILKRGIITLVKGDSEQRLVQARCIPVSLKGRARYNIENALAATSACVALGVSPGMIRDALKCFGNDSENPGRLDLFNVGEVKVIVDYGHNVQALQRTIETIKAMEIPGRAIAVVASPGDRRDDAIMNLGRVAAGGFDFIVIKEDRDLRGRKPGEVALLIGKGALEAGRRMSDIEIVLDEAEAVRTAVGMAQAGDLVVVFYEKYNIVVDALKELRDQAPFSRADEAIPIEAAPAEALPRRA